MTLLFGFGPFVLFAILSRLSPDVGLWAAFAAAFVVTVRDFVERPVLRLLDGASLLLFGALALWRGFLDPDMGLALLRTVIDLGLAAAISASLLRGRPFSLQYAGREGWSAADFLRVNYVVSLGWFAAFLAMAAADAAVAFAGAPFYIGIAVGAVALAFAIVLTLRYPAVRPAK